MNAPQNAPHDFPPQYVDVLLRQLAEYGRVPAATIYRTPDVAAPVAALGGLSAPLVVKFPEPGIVVALYGQELAGTGAAFAGTQVRVQMGGIQDLIVDGQGAGSFFGLLGLVGGAQNWFPIMRRASPQADWLVTFKNLQAAATATPQVGFSFISDALLSKMR